MNPEKINTMGRNELIMKLKDYNQRFTIIKGLLESYGQMSNDDLIGLIADALPDDFK